MSRKIIHIDMDAFYASVEQRDDPGLAGRPVIVGGLPGHRGVVSAASYEARKFGIHSAMPTSVALRLCPGCAVIFPNFEKYRDISMSLRAMYDEYTDAVEPLSLDECYLDVTTNKQDVGSATEIATRLKERIKRELNLTASAGVAPNKLIAKIASDFNKPDGLTVVAPGSVDRFMKELPVKKIWGVGKKTWEVMQKLGIETGADLQAYSLQELAGMFGIFGETLYYYCRGIDDRPVISEHEIKSVSHETTFDSDILDMGYLDETLRQLVDRTCDRMHRYGVKGRTITVKVKYDDFTQVTRSMTCEFYTSDADEIYNACRELMLKTEAGHRKVRLIGAAVSQLDTRSGGQLLLDLEM
jgi:DNA polymerase-4